jgi:hypothetical protein
MFDLTVWSPLAESKNGMTNIFYFPGIPHFLICPDRESLETQHPRSSQQLKNLKKVICMVQWWIITRQTINWKIWRPKQKNLSYHSIRMLKIICMTKVLSNSLLQVKGQTVIFNSIYWKIIYDAQKIEHIFNIEVMILKPLWISSPIAWACCNGRKITHFLLKWTACPQ